MIRKIYDYIRQYNMLAGCDRLVVGLSGGADSVCLLRVLKTIISMYEPQVRLVAVHINHGIRGQEADRDQKFAEQLCRELDVECVTRRVDVPKLSALEGVSEEDAGRKARYEVFAELAGEHGRIAVAHHMDDQAETVLMNMFRGSGIKGMGGMSPIRDNIIRPLLCVTRQEVENYLEELGQEFVTDSTNCENIYARNRVRNELLPYIKENCNQEAVKHIVDMSDYMRQCQAYIDKAVCDFMDNYVTKQPNGCRIDSHALKDAEHLISSGAVMSIVRRISGKQKDWYKVHVDSVVALADMQVGKSVDLPYGIRAVRTYDAIELSCEEKVSATAVCHWESEVPLAELVAKLENSEEAVCSIPVNMQVYDGEKLRMLESVVCRVSHNILTKNSFFDKKNIYTKCFDCGNIKGNLVFRFREDGDYLIVNRAGDKKKVKKELIDKKIPKELRGRILLLAEDSKVLWLAGVRRCEDFLVEDDTNLILTVDLKYQEER